MQWEITDEARRRNAEGGEIPPIPLEELIQSKGRAAKINAPNKAGSYRVFVYVTDGKGHAATANVLVQVSP